MLDRFPYFTKGDHFVGYYKFKDEKTVLYKYLNSVEKGKEIEIIYGEVN